MAAYKLYSDKSGNWFVIDGNQKIPVADEQEGLQLIEDLKLMDEEVSIWENAPKSNGTVR